MYKSKLQEYCHAKAWDLPVYSTTKEGFDHCPQFKATVTVNGSTFSTPDFFKSSKEAQNKVAQLAYDYLTGSLSGDLELSLTPTSCVVQKPKANETLQTASLSGVNSPKRNDTNFKGMAHLCKNQLQIYAQKRNLALPVYSSEREGPPHACQFRSKVTLEEKAYECSEYFSTIKDAENAAAKVALMALSSDGIQEEDPIVFKNLLQELAQKEYACLPEYSTAWTGASHMPMFLSTVEINSVSFTGEKAKTKKLAEMNAAKVAYTALKERSLVKDASYLSFAKLQSVVMEESPQWNSLDPKLSCNRGANQNAIGSEPINVGFYVDHNSSRQESRCSNGAPVQPASQLDLNTNIEPWPKANTSLSQKTIRVYPRMPNMTFPPCTTVLHKDEKWVALTPKPVQGNG